MSRRQNGFKAHLTLEPNTGLITGCTLPKASGADGYEAAVGPYLLDADDEPGHRAGRLRLRLQASSALNLGQRGHADRVKRLFNVNGEVRRPDQYG